MEEFQPGTIGPPVAGVTGGRGQDGDHPTGAAGAEADAAGLGEVQPSVSAATYWRRRVLALAVGIGLITILAWAVNGTLGGGAAPGHQGGSAARSGSPNGQGHHQPRRQGAE
jgi:hypothetical protein